MPASGPSRFERAASANAASARRATTLPIGPSKDSIRRSASVTSSVGCTRPSRTAALSSRSIRCLSLRGQHDNAPRAGRVATLPVLRHRPWRSDKRSSHGRSRQDRAAPQHRDVRRAPRRSARATRRGRKRFRCAGRPCARTAESTGQRSPDPDVRTGHRRAGRADPRMRPRGVHRRALAADRRSRARGPRSRRHRCDGLRDQPSALHGIAQLRLASRSDSSAFSRSVSSRPIGCSAKAERPSGS